MTTTRDRAVAMAADLTRSPADDIHVQRYADAIEPRIDTMPDAELRQALIAEARARLQATAEVIRQKAAAAAEAAA